MKMPDFGYRKKPLWIYIVSGGFIIAPFGNFLWSLAQSGVPYWWTPSVWAYWVRFIPVSNLLLMGLIFATGLSLWFVRSWAFYMAIGTLALTVLHNVLLFKEFNMGALAVAAMIVGTVVVAATLSFNRVRKPYLNPRVRWWESSPRYSAGDVPVRMMGHNGVLLDVSMTGVLVEFPTGKPVMGKEVPELELGNADLKLPCHVARETEKALGLQFNKLTREQKKKLKAFLSALPLKTR